MRRTPLLAALTVALMAGNPGSSAAAKPPGPAVRATLDALLEQGRIDRATHDRDLAGYDAAQATLKRLHGRRLTELKAVVANLDALSASGGLTPERLPLSFLTLARNREWWPSRPLLPYGRRVTFEGSDLVWQSYPGQGLQVQWLATFGVANGLFTGRTYDDRFRALLDEALALAVPRAGGIAWESLFRFDGGRPPWVSGLSAGTALQAFSRGAVRLGERRYFEAARAALGVFRTAPPEGIRLDRPDGAHFLIYSFAPKLLVLNAFVQALNGLFDFAKYANDEEGRALLAAGEAELRAELPAFDTGAWSMYSLGRRESDLGYHRLVTTFLRALCGRTEGPWCGTAARFAGYERTPPRVTLLAARVRGRSVVVPYQLDKVSTVTTRITRSGRPLAGRTARLGRGRHELRFTARAKGSYAIRVRAVDLAGNAGTATGAVRRR